MPEDKNGNDIAKAPKAGTAAKVERNPKEIGTYRIFGRPAEEVEKAMTILKNNLRGQKLTERDLPRVTVPAGGNTIWTVHTPEGDEHHEELTGILIEYTMPRAYWEKPLTPGNVVPPDCSSPDGIKGVGKPGGDCPSCPFNLYGTAQGEGQTGKACKEKRMLFMVRPDHTLPMVVQAPSTSIRHTFDYVMGLGNDETTFHSVYTQLGLEKVGMEPMAYSRITFKNVGAVDEEYLPRIEAYQKAFADILGSIVEVTADSENLSEPADGNGQVVEGKVAEEAQTAEATG